MSTRIFISFLMAFMSTFLGISSGGTGLPSLRSFLLASLFPSACLPLMHHLSGVSGLPCSGSVGVGDCGVGGVFGKALTHLLFSGCQYRGTSSTSHSSSQPHTADQRPVVLDCLIQALLILFIQRKPFPFQGEVVPFALVLPHHFKPPCAGSRKAIESIALFRLRP